MKVHELLRELQGMDPDIRVLVDGYESGCDEPVLRRTQAARNPEPKGYDGDWIAADIDQFSREVPAGAEPVVVIGRSWG